MVDIHLDFETFSAADIKKTGAWVYSRHKSTEILCFAFAVGAAEPELWLPETVPLDNPAFDDLRKNYKIHVGPNLPEALQRHIEEGAIFHAHNSFFEQSIWKNVGVDRLGWPELPIARWRCTAALAASYSLPRALKDVCLALDLDDKKDESGKRFMLKLSKPRKPSKTDPSTRWGMDKVPDQYATVYQYCLDDVRAERGIHKRLGALSKKEQNVWFVDQIINHRGVHVDVELAERMLDLTNCFIDKQNVRLAEITNGAVEKGTNVAALTNWVNCERFFYDEAAVLEFNKEAVENVLATTQVPQIKEVCEIRQQVGKTSTGKFTKFISASDTDKRIRDTLMYWGANTGRWTAKLVQMQNLPGGNIEDMDEAVEFLSKCSLTELERRTDGKVMQYLSSAIRGLIYPPKGSELLAADYSSIEARTLLWIALDERGMDIFRRGDCIYKDMASSIYGVPVEEVTKDQRKMGKVAILGLGYGMGFKKFTDTANAWGVPTTETEAKKVVDLYRSKYDSIKETWYEQERIAKAAIRHKGQWMATNTSKTRWCYDDDFLHCRLPSGRTIKYYKPTISKEPTAWGEARDTIMFWGEKALTAGGTTGGRKWCRQSTYGGKLVENINQGIARDIMAEAIIRLHKAGFHPVLSVHDELICEEKIGDKKLSDMVNIMCEVPAWAEGCPIGADGWVGQRYHKD